MNLIIRINKEINVGFQEKRSRSNYTLAWWDDTNPTAKSEIGLGQELSTYSVSTFQYSLKKLNQLTSMWG